jgi:glycosyltransferase involved in cell wall biosynthesis
MSDEISRIEPRVSIGLPVFNGERYLKEALTSLLSQTFTNFELIISDNASTDGTGKICAEYARQDQRIRYYRAASNMGVNRNSNKVFELSKGEYFRWASHDDVSSIHLLERCVAVLDSKPDVVLCYGKTVLIDPDGGKISAYEDGHDLPMQSPAERYVTYFERAGLCNLPYGLIRSAELKRTRLFCDLAVSDLLLMGELALYGKFIEIPEELFFRRMHPTAGSLARSEKALEEVYGKELANRQGRFARCKRFTYEMAAVNRAPIALREKGKIIFWLLRQIVWSRDEFVREIAMDLFAYKRSRAL